MNDSNRESYGFISFANTLPQDQLL